MVRRGSPFRRLVTAVFLAGFLFGLFTARGFSWNPPDEANVNSRYTVESVELAGASEAKLSKSLQDDLRRAIGQRFSPEAFARLSTRIREELKAKLVLPKLLRGNSPESVRVVLDVRGKPVLVNTSGSHFSWHGANGWSGDATLNISGRKGQTLTTSISSDANRGVERVAGLRAAYTMAFVNNRVRPGFAIASTHAEYAPQTPASASPGDLYRHVSTFQPSLAVLPWRGEREELTLESGVRFQKFQLESPTPNRNVASHALVNTLTYHRVRGDVDNGQWAASASYGITQTLDSLGSDYHFRRQEARAGLEYHRRPHRLTIDLIGGNLHGRAPLPDRFAAGTTTVLRGWNKWELAPLGGERLIASAVEYGRTLKRRLEAAVFVDSGAIWNRTTTAVSRTSAGCGLRTSDGFFFYVAFPLRDGRIEPVFMTGANF